MTGPPDPSPEQADATVRSRSACTAAEAFDTLRVIGQAEHRTLPQVAQHVLDDVVGRARARRARG